MGLSLWLAAPTFLFAPLLTTLGYIAAIFLAVQSVCHWIALRDLRRGLLVIASDHPLIDDALRRSHLVSVVAAVASLPIVILLCLPCLLPMVSFPGSLRFGAFAILLPLFLAAQLTARQLLLSIADLARVRDELPRVWMGTMLLAGSIAPVFLGAVAMALADQFAPPLDEHLFLAGFSSFLIFSLPALAALWLQYCLTAGVALAVPRSTHFNDAARRVARAARGPVRLPPRAKEEDLSPLTIIEDEPPKQQR